MKNNIQCGVKKDYTICRWVVIWGHEAGAEEDNIQREACLSMWKPAPTDS